MRNIKLILAYEGTDFLGWQKTKEGPSVEEALQKALEQILQEPQKLQAASRTDAGVHAAGQVVNFFTNKELPSYDKMVIGLNALLPDSLRVLEITEAPAGFHPTLDCRGKEYHYWICGGRVQMPQNRRYSWHVHHPMDIGAMLEAARLLTGRHDFSAFCNQKKNEVYEDKVREVDALILQQHEGERLQWIIRGNHFLYKMARNLVGTLTYVGVGKIRLEEVSHLLTSQDRTLSGVTAPAHGLCLHKVFY